MLPPVALLISWRVALGAAGMCALIVGVGALWLHREPPDAQRGGGRGQQAGVVDLLARRDVRAVLVFVFLFGAGQWCYLTYLTLYLTEAIGVSVVAAGMLLAAGQLGGALSRVGWGFASDRLLGGRRRPILVAVGLLAVAMALSMAMLSASTPSFVVGAVAVLMGLSLLGWNGLAHTLVAELTGTRAAGIAVGMTTSVGFLGVIFLPAAFGAVVDASGSYRAAWLLLSGMLFAAVCSLFAVTDLGSRDSRKPSKLRLTNG